MTESEIVSVVYSELLKVLGGAAVILATFSAFLGKIWINRIANKEGQVRDERIAQVRASFEQQNAELQAKLDATVQKSVFIDKLQFEHEYSIYKQVWEALYNLRKATVGLRPLIDFQIAKVPKEIRLKNRINVFAEPFNTYRDLIEKNKPFYAEPVYKALFDVLEECYSERIDSEYNEQLSPMESFEEARDNQKAILEAIDAACQSIRDRIEEVRVA